MISSRIASSGSFGFRIKGRAFKVNPCGVVTALSFPVECHGFHQLILRYPPLYGKSSPVIRFSARSIESISSFWTKGLTPSCTIKQADSKYFRPFRTLSARVFPRRSKQFFLKGNDFLPKALTSSVSEGCITTIALFKAGWLKKTSKAKEKMGLLLTVSQLLRKVGL